MCKQFLRFQLKFFPPLLYPLSIFVLEDMGHLTLGYPPDLDYEVREVLHLIFGSFHFFLHLASRPKLAGAARPNPVK